MRNSQRNRNPQAKVPSEPDSGVSFNVRLSETLLAIVLTAGVSFGSGWAYGSTQNVNQNQNVNNCVQAPATKAR